MTYGLSISELQSQGYIDEEGNLTSLHDAATVNWGGGWRMPTKTEMQELIDECTWKRITHGGEEGYKVTGPNGNSIFLPFVGFCMDSMLCCAGRQYCCWSSTPSSSYNACILRFNSVYDCSRNYGCAVRPCFIDEAYIEITPDTVIDDIYVKFTLKYPHLHLRFLSESGVMEEVIDSSKTVAEIRKMLKTKPEVESGEVQIGEKRVISDVCKEFDKYGIGDTWVCCHYGEDKEPEPHGSDRTLAFAEKDSVEDAPYMIAGMRKITEDGKIIEETPMSLSEKFGILAAVMAGMDDKVEKEEIEMIMGIVRQNSDMFDIDELRTALLKELNGIREYESHSAIVKTIDGIDREIVFQALVMVAVSDFKLTQDELSLLSGIADLWEWNWDYCASVIRNIINTIQEANGGREVEIEE